MLSRLPGWMKMANDPSSFGWQFICGVFGQRAQVVEDDIREDRDNQFIGSANPNEPDYVYFTRHDKSRRKMPARVDVQGWGLNYTGISGVIAPIETYTVEEFFNKLATRLIYTDNDYIAPSGITGIIRGIDYCIDFGPSGTIDADKVYIINEYISADEEDANPTKIYDTSDLALVAEYNYGRETQSYQSVGFDEQLTFVSGVAVLEHIPLPSSFELLDYGNMDASGSPTIISSDMYTLSDHTVTDASGTLLPGTDYIAALDSSYIAEYDYLAYEYPTYVTTTDNFWNVNKWKGNRPLFSVVPASGEYTGTQLAFSLAKSPVEHGAALSFHPLDLRPGTNVEVEFTYTAFASGSWSDTSTAFSDTFTLSNAVEPIDTRGIRLYQGSAEITEYVSFTAGWDSTASTLTLTALSSAENQRYPVVDVFWFYQARRTGTYTSEPSIATNPNDGPRFAYDYFIEDRINEDTGRKQEHVLPASIVHVTPSGILDDGEESSEVAWTPLGYMPLMDLSNATQDQFTVTQDLQFGGITYDKDKNLVWVIEQTNQRLYKYNADNGMLIDRYNIFKPNRLSDDVRSFISPSGAEGVALDSYPYIPHDYDAINSPRGMLYLDGYLWVLNYPYEYDNIYYVDPEFGNDNNAGTSPGRAFASMWKAAQVVGAGDWVVMLPGIHDIFNSDQGAVAVFTANGTATTPIQILFSPGAYLATSSNSPSVHTLTFQGDYYIIRDLRVDPDREGDFAGRTLFIVITGNNCKLIDWKISDKQGLPDSLQINGNNNEISFLRVANEPSYGTQLYGVGVAGDGNNIHHSLFLSDFYTGPTLLGITGDNNTINHCTFATRPSYNHAGTSTWVFDTARDCFQQDSGTRTGCSITGYNNIYKNNLTENMMNGLGMTTDGDGLSRGNEVYHNRFHCCFVHSTTGEGVFFQCNAISVDSVGGRSMVESSSYPNWYQNQADYGGRDYSIYPPAPGWNTWYNTNEPQWTQILHPIAGVISYQPSRIGMLDYATDGTQVGYFYPGRPLDMGFVRIDTYDENRIDIKWDGETSTEPAFLPLPWDISLTTIVHDVSVGPNNEILVGGADKIYNAVPKYDYYMVDTEDGTIYYREKYAYLDIDGVNKPLASPNLIEGT